MEWDVAFTDQFERWWNGLSEDEQDSWIKWSDFYRCVVLHSGDRTPTLFNLHGTRT
jgi:hypothetical protein